MQRPTSQPCGAVEVMTTECDPRGSVRSAIPVAAWCPTGPPVPGGVALDWGAARATPLAGDPATGVGAGVGSLAEQHSPPGALAHAMARTADVCELGDNVPPVAGDTMGCLGYCSG